MFAPGIGLAQSSPLSNSAEKSGTASRDTTAEAEPIGGFPKISFSTLGNLELAGMAAASGPSRDPRPSLRFDSTALLNLSDELSIDGLFQFKPRQPLRSDDPNKDLFINQGASRREGGKMKELYVRYGDYRIGKFVQNFGRAYVLLPGPYAADFIEETEQGYEPTEMVGVERIHVFDDEGSGWRQLSFSAFFVDRTFLHRSFPYDEGVIHYRNGGVGNTRYPENFMVTYDVLNMPVGQWAQMTWQASAIRFGKSFGAERGEVWSTLNGDMAIPINGSVASTLSRSYSQLHFYGEAVRRQNFQGFAGRSRDFLSASAEYLSGSWIFDATTTQRWTTDRVMPLQRDKLYTATVGYKLPSQTIVSFSLAHEEVDHRRGLYAGVRLTQTLTTCSRCLVKGQAY
ncbi:MAG: hypothetical protein ABI277_00395 [Burkholderiaceae bacterium]